MAPAVQQSLQVKNSFKRDCWEQFRNELWLFPFSSLASSPTSKLSSTNGWEATEEEETIAGGKFTGRKRPTNFYCSLTSRSLRKLKIFMNFPSLAHCLNDTVGCEEIIAFSGAMEHPQSTLWPLAVHRVDATAVTCFYLRSNLER